MNNRVPPENQVIGTEPATPEGTILAFIRRRGQSIAIGALAILTTSAGTASVMEAVPVAAQAAAAYEEQELAPEPGPEAAYMPLLDTIAMVESRGNYNAYYGNADNSSTIFTSMPVAEVLQWQKNYVNSGSPSSAVGKYQFIHSTLSGLIAQQSVDMTAPFNEDLQDRLAAVLLERRGLQSYLANEITITDFAHNLSQEWAALPQVTGDNPEASFYDGDGVNKALISVGEILPVIESLK